MAIWDTCPDCVAVLYTIQRCPAYCLPIGPAAPGHWKESCTWVPVWSVVPEIGTVFVGAAELFVHAIAVMVIG